MLDFEFDLVFSRLHGLIWTWIFKVAFHFEYMPSDDLHMRVNQTFSALTL